MDTLQVFQEKDQIFGDMKHENSSQIFFWSYFWMMWKMEIRKFI